MNKYIDLLHKDNKSKLPVFKAGDTIQIHLKIKEKNKERIQKFQGVVIQCQGKNMADKTFTLRKISNGTAVERIFPINLPAIEKIQVIRQGKVRRARLFYLRGKQGKAAKIKHIEGRSKKTKTTISTPQPTSIPQEAKAIEPTALNTTQK